MNLLDVLLSADAEQFDEKQTAPFKSAQLRRKLQLKEDAVIILQEISARRATALMKTMYDKNGNFDFNRSFEAKLRVLVDGIKEPDLKNKQLQEHFECDTATELAEKLFGLEATPISDKILELSGIVTDEAALEEQEDEIKNC